MPTGKCESGSEFGAEYRQKAVPRKCDLHIVRRHNLLELLHSWEEGNGSAAQLGQFDRRAQLDLVENRRQLRIVNLLAFRPDHLT